MYVMLVRLSLYVLCTLLHHFFFNDTATTEIYTLSLHDALPILLDARKIISINGAADEKVEADQAIVALTIKNEARTLDGALQENEKLQAQVKKGLLDGGITADKIKAANFSSTPDYGWLKEIGRAHV